MVNGFIEIALTIKPLLNSVERIIKLTAFNEKKNEGFYVDFKNVLLIPQIEIKKTDLHLQVN